MKNTIKIATVFATIIALLLIIPNRASATTKEVKDEESLISAISSADSGDTISIQKNITITKPIVIAKELIIDGNGYTLTGSSDWTSTSGNQTMFTAQGSSAKLTLKDINLMNGPKYGVQSYDGATVILDNVNITGFNYGGVLVNGGNVEVINLHLGYNGTGANNGIEIDKGAYATNNPTLTMNGVLTSDAKENVVRAADNGHLTEFTIENTENTTNKIFVTDGAVVLTDEYNNVISETVLPDTITPNVDKEKVFVTIMYNDKSIKTVVNKDEKITAELVKSHIVIEDNYRIDGLYADAEYKTEFDFNNAITTDTTIYAKISEVPTEEPEKEPEEVVEEEKDDTPKTGVNSYLGLATFIIALSVAGIIITKKRNNV